MEEQRETLLGLLSCIGRLVVQCCVGGSYAYVRVIEGKIEPHEEVVQWFQLSSQLLHNSSFICFEKSQSESLVRSSRSPLKQPRSPLLGKG